MNSVARRESLKILKILKKDRVSIEIYLVGDRKMRELNKKFRGKDNPTNVLSFQSPKGFIFPQEFGGFKTKNKFLGEIYLDISQIKKEAKILWKISLEDFFLKLLIHAILHLSGYDHKKKSDRIKMEKKENYVFHRLRHRIISN